VLLELELVPRITLTRPAESAPPCRPPRQANRHLRRLCAHTGALIECVVTPASPLCLPLVKPSPLAQIRSRPLKSGRAPPLAGAVAAAARLCAIAAVGSQFDGPARV
jgi:hypothetical protein